VKTAKKSAMKAAHEATVTRLDPEIGTAPKSEIAFPSALSPRGRAVRGEGANRQIPPKKVVVAGLGGFALVLVLGVWVIVRDKDDNEVGRIKVPEGSTVVQTGEPGASATGAPAASGEAVQPPRWALALDGESAVRVPRLARDKETPLTLECWCHIDAKNQYRAVLVLGGKEWYGIGHDPQGCCYLVTERVPLNTRFGATSPLRTGKWVHLAAVADGREGRLYLDGKLQARGPLSETAEPHTQPPAPELILGGTLYNSNLGSCMTGQMRAVRVSGSARYNADFTPPERFAKDKDTLALYHFDEGQGDKLTDSSGNNHHGAISGANWVPAEPTSRNQ
jgi:hypothetical protein